MWKRMLITVAALVLGATATLAQSPEVTTSPTPEVTVVPSEVPSPSSSLIPVQPGDVTINEVMWAGKEYVELLNVTDEEVVMTGWELWRQKKDSEPERMVLFDEGDIIEAGGYFVIEASEDATEREADKVKTLGLVDAGALLVLRDHDGMAIDEANQAGGWFAGENVDGGISMERLNAEADGKAAESWSDSSGTLYGRRGTPGEENSEPDVNDPPEAKVEGPEEIYAGEEVEFSASQSSDADEDDLTFSWNFGDGETGAGENVTHVYSSAGEYSVVLTVSDGELTDEARHVIKVSKRSYSREIVINEVMPNPEGADADGEFVELYNKGGGEVDLEGWVLEYGTQKYVIQDASVSAGEYEVLEYSRSKKYLTNSGGTVRLRDPNGEEVSVVEYPKIKEGWSYSREDDGDFTATSTVTEGEGNVFSGEEDEEEDEESDEEDEEGASPSPKVAGTMVKKLKLADVRDEEAGVQIETEGVVSAPPELLGKGVMYLAGSGIQVYLSKGKYPALVLGDKVRVTGKLSSISGEARLRVASAADVKKIGSGEAPVAHQIETGEVDEEEEGWVVAVKGEVARTSGATFYVDDGSGEVKVVVKPSTGIKKPKMKKGMAVTVTGVVSETSTGYRILPRFQDDVQTGAVLAAKSFPKAGWVPRAFGGYGGQAGLGVVVLLSGWLLWTGRKVGEPVWGSNLE